MKTAQEFAQAALDIGAMADRMKPPEGDQYSPGRQVAVCYLRMAAAEARKISEALEKQEHGA